jgi:hypothetical protein
MRTLKETLELSAASRELMEQNLVGTTSIYEAQFAIFIDFPTVVNAKAVTVQTPSFMRLSTVFTVNPNS